MTVVTMVGAETKIEVSEGAPNGVLLRIERRYKGMLRGRSVEHLTDTQAGLLLIDLLNYVDVPDVPAENTSMTECDQE